ncbi:uncharacterized protein TRAVEDRAFT_43064 [Trametes versicolor FP-101664 SS1]|uniref:uncharacterized protein n=1 Tax=Trametes versicolor (strain FP-101664) TaxID=717944 RepID=UPI00046241F7|nr:uncharacterized protein TRAVEDRAFT_43064 [Trametes versicolor FP-101664 SS1]EIW62728.1 hypothetical protein TRAVEDRAFT_43064 [Trametes versicolor FP-101664 SS1]
MSPRAEALSTRPPHRTYVALTAHHATSVLPSLRDAMAYYDSMGTRNPHRLGARSWRDSDERTSRRPSTWRLNVVASTSERTHLERNGASTWSALGWSIRRHPQRSPPAHTVTVSRSLYLGCDNRTAKGAKIEGGKSGWQKARQGDDGERDQGMTEGAIKGWEGTPHTDSRSATFAPTVTRLHDNTVPRSNFDTNKTVMSCPRSRIDVRNTDLTACAYTAYHYYVNLISLRPASLHPWAAPLRSGTHSQTACQALRAPRIARRPLAHAHVDQTSTGHPAALGRPPRTSDDTGSA